MLKDTLMAEIKEAMKNKDSEKSAFLRNLISAFNNEAINLKKKDEGLTEQEELQVLKREAKKRKDSIAQFESGGRPELAENEKKELAIIETYLPEQMSAEKIAAIVEKVINEMGEISPSQFGEVMKKVMAETQGQADGTAVSQIVKEKINK